MAKNQAESIKQRLLNLARARKEDYNFVLRQYVLQRIMYRIGASAYSKDFMLKGGLLFWVWNEDFHRPTKDMDLLAFGADDITLLRDKFINIIQIKSDDGLIFNEQTLQASPIKEDAKYQGVRITGSAKLVNALIPFQIDIGFGDAVKPVQHTTKIPVFLDELPVPKLKIYPVESVIAEKFHAMIVLGLANSRMKDFYDVFVIANTMSLSSEPLQNAIRATFNRRETTLYEDKHYIFSKPFKSDEGKQIQWNAFLRKNRINDIEEFTIVVEKIQQFLEPVYHQNWSNNWDKRKWNKNNWIWE
jgi:predicted nucleotidyltransferase component of viral defense system